MIQKCSFVFRVGLEKCKNKMGVAHKEQTPSDLTRWWFEKLEKINIQIKEKRPELAMLESFIDEAHVKIGKIEAGHEKSLRLQNVADMIERPVELDMTPDGFTRLSLVLLRGMVEYANHNHPTLEAWIKNAKYHVESAANAITKMLMG